MRIKIDTNRKFENDVFIKLLDYGATAGLNGISVNEIKTWAQDNEFPNNIFVANLRDECFHYKRKDDNQYYYVLKTEYYYRLVEFYELKEARKASD